MIKAITKTIKNGAKEQKVGFLQVLLRNLCAILLGNLLTGKGTIIAGEGTTRSGQNFNAASSLNKLHLNLIVFMQ